MPHENTYTSDEVFKMLSDYQLDSFEKANKGEDCLTIYEFFERYDYQKSIKT